MYNRLSGDRMGKSSYLIDFSAGRAANLRGPIQADAGNNRVTDKDPPGIALNESYPTSDASFIDRGQTMTGPLEEIIRPHYEYAHPARSMMRFQVWKPDPGAYEFCGWRNRTGARN